MKQAMLPTAELECQITSCLYVFFNYFLFKLGAWWNIGKMDFEARQTWVYTPTPRLETLQS